MHELPLLIFTLFLQGSVGVTLWLAFGGRILHRVARCCLPLGRLCWRAWGCSPQRCIWAIRSMP
nr:hypothetical protein [Enterobacter bugandensis]